jgi:hypothetical protein
VRCMEVKSRRTSEGHRVAIRGAFIASKVGGYEPWLVKAVVARPRVVSRASRRRPSVDLSGAALEGTLGLS